MLRFSPMGYVYSMGTVFALYFGVSFFSDAMNGFPQFQSERESRADSSCKSRWVDNARNDMALKCYLSVDVMRFCEPAERAHLAWLVSQYEQHQANYEQTLMTYLVQVQMGYNNAFATERDPLKALNKSQRNAAESVMTPEFRKVMKLPTLLDKEVAELFRKVFRKGLLKRDDLNWSIPSYIEKAFVVKFGDPDPAIASCRVES
jgi:hypothetical protein